MSFSRTIAGPVPFGPDRSDQPGRPMPDAILRSWRRCLRYGLDPFRPPEDAVLTQSELREARDQSGLLMSIARPELELLSAQIAGRNHMTAFANAEGVLLDAVLDQGHQSSSLARTIQPGSNWREDRRGTNALGLALHLGATCIVSGAEHFFSDHSGVYCVSTPIFSSDGKIMGLLDATSEVPGRQDHTRALLTLAATKIENDVFVATHVNDLILRFHPRSDYLTTPSVGLVAFDKGGVLTGINKCAAQFLAGLIAQPGAAFHQLFMGSFDRVTHGMRTAGLAHVTDALGSTYSARLHAPDIVTGRSMAGRKRLTPRQDAPKAKRMAVILDDDLVREGVRVAQAMLGVNLPVCIVGEPGTGKTSLVENLHARGGMPGPLLHVDCSKIADAGAIGQDIANDLATDAVLQQGGTIVLDQMSELGKEIPDQLATLLDHVSRGATSDKWTLVATMNEVNDGARTVQLGPVQFHVVHLPPVSQRTDFGKIVKALLQELAGHDQISSQAIAALARRPMPQNFRDVKRNVAMLAATCQKNVIRVEQVDRHLPLSQAQAAVCPKCQGNRMREKKCRDIRKMYDACQGNITLTARRLGVARNTVYLHVRGAG